MNTFDKKNLEKLAKQASVGSKSTIDIFLKMLKLAQYSFKEFDTNTESRQNKPKVEFFSPSENISFVQNNITDSDEFKSRKQRAEDAVQLINTKLNSLKLEIERLNNGFGEIEGLRKIRESQTYFIAALKKNIDAASKKNFIEDKKLAQDYKNELDNLREDYAQEYTNGNIGIEEIENIKNEIIQKIEYIPGNKTYIQELNVLHDAFKKILTEKLIEIEGKKYSFSELRDEAKKIIFDNKTKAAFIEFIQTQAVEGITREQKWSISDIATNRLMGMTLSNQARDEADEIANEVSKDPLFYETLLRDFVRRKPIKNNQGQTTILFNLSAYLKRQLALQKLTQMGYIQRNPGELVDKERKQIDVSQIEPTTDEYKELSLQQWQELAEDPSQILLSYYLNGDVLPALKSIHGEIIELQNSDLNPQEKNEKLKELQKEYNRTKDDKIKILQEAFNPKYKRNKQMQMGDLQREINNMIQELAIDDVIDAILSKKSTYKIIPKLLDEYMKANPENIFLVKNLLNGIIKSELIDQAKETLKVSIPKVFEKRNQYGTSGVAKIDLAWLLAKQKILKAEEFLKRSPEAQQKLLEEAMEMLQFEKDASGAWEKPDINLVKASIYQHVSPMLIGVLLAKAKEKYPNFEYISGDEKNEIVEEIYNKMYGYNVPNPKDPGSNLTINFPLTTEKGEGKTGYTMKSRQDLEKVGDPQQIIMEDLIQRVERAIQNQPPYTGFKKAEDNVSEHRYSTLELMIRKYAFKR